MSSQLLVSQRPRRSPQFLCRWLTALGIAVLLCGSVARGQGNSPSGYQSYALKHRAANDVAPQLRSMLQGLPEPGNVLIDAQRNQLLVQGSSEAHKVAAQFVQAIDQPLETVRKPDSTAPEVQGYRLPAGDNGAVVTRLQTEFGHLAGVRIALDDRTRQIIVVAPAGVQQQVAQRLRAAEAAGQTPDQTPAPPPGSVAYQLRHITWRELEDALTTAWGSKIRLNVSQNGEVATVETVVADSATPVLQINRRADVVRSLDAAAGAHWLATARALDVAPAGPDSLTRLVPVQNTNPEQVRSAVSLIQAAATQADSDMTTVAKPLRPAMDRPRWGGELLAMLFQDAAAPTAPVRPAAAAPAAAGQAAPAPAAPAAPAGGGEAPPPGVREATELPPEGGLIGPVQIEFLEGLDSILVRGNKRDVQRVLQIIADIERLTAETAPVIDIYTLRHVNSESLATMLNELYTAALATRQGTISIRALTEPNAILLIGRLESVEVVKELIVKLDQPSDPSYRFEIFHLQYMAAIDAETAVRNFFVNRPGTDTTPRTNLGTQVRVLSDYRSNSLIVQASPRDLLEVTRLIQGLDVEDIGTSTIIRVFRLRNALSADLQTVIQNAITPPTTGQQGQAGFQAGAAAQGRASVPSSALEFMMVDQQGGRLLRSGILSNVQVTADPNINALVVRAPAKSMDLIAALIEQLDQLPDAVSQIKVFTVVNGDATSLAQLLQTLFGQQVTAGVGTAGGLGGLFGGGLGALQLQTGAGTGESSLVPLRFAVDVRTNSIIASGSEGDLTVVEVLLLRLDEGDIENRRLTVVRLKNAPATDVSNSITQFLTSQRQFIQQQLLFNQAISPFEQIEREVIVVPEIVTNSLIVSATPRYYDEIMRVIEDLDFRPPMVMVQVLIAEVRLDETFQFGVEWGLQESLLFDRGLPGTASNPGFNFNNVGLPNQNSAGRNELAGQSLVNFGLGRTNPTLGYGGLVLSAASESINIMVRALQDTGRLQVLSRPQVMTLNNQQAFVQVGATQSRITGSAISQGIVQNQVTDVETGLILRIQPLINDDGVIVMNVDAERSELGEEIEGPTVAFGPDGEPIRSPPINRTTAQTTISARSGQTVVFAGLITKDKVANIRRVPYVSDIPVLGHLFRHTVTAEQRRELLIVLTPYIIESDEDYEWVKMVESERMSYCLADAVQLHGAVGLQGDNCLFCQPTVPVLYPDSDPLGLKLPPSTGMSMEHFTPTYGVPTNLPPSMLQNPTLTPVPANQSLLPSGPPPVPPPVTPPQPEPSSGANRTLGPQQTPFAAPQPPTDRVQPAQFATPTAGPADPTLRLPPTR